MNHKLAIISFDEACPRFCPEQWGPGALYRTFSISNLESIADDDSRTWLLETYWPKYHQFLLIAIRHFPLIWWRHKRSFHFYSYDKFLLHFPRVLKLGFDLQRDFWNQKTKSRLQPSVPFFLWILFSKNGLGNGPTFWNLVPGFVNSGYDKGPFERESTLPRKVS